MRQLHRPTNDSSNQPVSTSGTPPADLSDGISASMRRNLSLLRVACESFISTAAYSSESETDAPAGDDEGHVWVYLPALRSDGESDEIRLLASTLADQFGLVASVIVETSSVTVILERRGNA